MTSEIRGVNGTISFDGRFVTITRKGFMARATVGKGEKRIPVKNISAVQLKPASALIRGYIQFTVPGGNENRSRMGKQTIDAAKDENSVVFTPKQQPGFEQLRAQIEEAI